MRVKMTKSEFDSLSYVDAGVDVAAAESTVKAFSEIAMKTMRPEVLSGVGPFAGLFNLPTGFQEPVLVASADGVGTKILIATALDRFDSVGADLVNHCVNDILTVGARPLFFMDYLATADLSQSQRIDIVSGVGSACAQQNVALLGGETADMPDMYRSGDFDLAGFIVGIVDRSKIIDGKKINIGDVLVALPSSGLQTNGYSLVRKIWSLGKGLGSDHDKQILQKKFPLLNRSLGDELLATHQSFLPDLDTYLEEIHGIAHITGGGIGGNLSRLFEHDKSNGMYAWIDTGSWEIPNIFKVIQEAGSVADSEMFGAFNMGVGIIVVVKEVVAQKIISEVEGSWLVGEIRKAESQQKSVEGLPE